MKDWKCASESGCCERIYARMHELLGETRVCRGAYDGVEVRFHELFLCIGCNAADKGTDRGGRDWLRT